jgi:hypothetical protein
MTIAEVGSGTAVTVSSTEFSMTNNSTSIATQTTKGFYQCYVDLSNMAAGDQYEVAVQEKVRSGGTQRRMVIGTFTGAMPDFFMSPAILLFWGWDFTIKKLAGTDRAFDWSIRSVT